MTLFLEKCMKVSQFSYKYLLGVAQSVGVWAWGIGLQHEAGEVLTAYSSGLGAWDVPCYMAAHHSTISTHFMSTSPLYVVVFRSNLH